MNEDLVIQKIIKLEEDVTWVKEQMAAKLDTQTFLNGQDEIIKVLRDIQTEQAATNHALRRHEDRIETLETDVQKIKLQVNLAN